LSQLIAMAGVPEFASYHFIVNPLIRVEIHRGIPAINALNLPPILRGHHFGAIHGPA
jgi:hypothetical protein